MGKGTWLHGIVSSVRRPTGNALAFGGLAFVFFTLIFFGLAWDVGRDAGQPTESDWHLLGAVRQLRSPVMDRLMRWLTALGEPLVVGLAALAVGLALAAYRRYDYLVTLLLAVGGSAGLVFALKRVFTRPRPPVELALVAETGFSFPSGHATAAVVLYGLLAYLLARQCTTVAQRILVAAAGAALIFGVGFSRLYLGVHWPTDVVAGFSLGAAWLSILLALDLRRR